jgi:hypothetical protein
MSVSAQSPEGLPRSSPRPRSVLATSRGLQLKRPGKRKLTVGSCQRTDRCGRRAAAAAAGCRGLGDRRQQLSGSEVWTLTANRLLGLPNSQDPGCTLEGPPLLPPSAMSNVLVVLSREAISFFGSDPRSVGYLPVGSLPIRRFSRSGFPILDLRATHGGTHAQHRATSPIRLLVNCRWAGSVLSAGSKDHCRQFSA